jgi:hypothetical protein
MKNNNSAARFFRYLGFDHMIAPVLIKMIYWIGVVAIIGAGIGAFLSAMHTSEKQLVAGVLAVGAIVLCLLIWRLVSELWILAFNIYERLVEIRDLLARRQRPEEHRPLPRVTVLKR